MKAISAVQQAIAQVLTPVYEKQFSYRYVVDMDLEKYFDTVNQRIKAN